MKPMDSRSKIAGCVVVALAALAQAAAEQRGISEQFVGIANMTRAAGGFAVTPVTITVDRKMSDPETSAFVEAFRSGGVAGLKKALEGVPPTGSVRLGEQTTPTRLTIESTVFGGRILTLVTDQPLRP